MSNLDIMRSVWYKDENDSDKIKRLSNYSPEEITEAETNYLHEKLFSVSNKNTREIINSVLNKLYNFQYPETKQDLTGNIAQKQKTETHDVLENIPSEKVESIANEYKQDIQKLGEKQVVQKIEQSLNNEIAGSELETAINNKSYTIETRYMWKSKEPLVSDNCINLNNKEFKDYEEVPRKEHPDCACELEKATFLIDSDGKEEIVDTEPAEMKEYIEPEEEDNKEDKNKDKKEKSITKYIWHCNNLDTTCDKCAELHGQEFANMDHVPNRPHPNCKCIVRVVEISKNEKGEKVEKKIDKKDPQDWKPKEKPSNQLTEEEKEQRKKDKELLKKVGKIVKEHEKTINHAYLDTKGKITVGNGYNIDGTSDPEKTFMQAPWRNKKGEKASLEEKQAEWNKLQELKNILPKNEKGEYNYTYIFYEERMDLTISNEYAEEKMLEHLKDDLESIRKKFPDFDKYPESAQSAILDMEYNMGGNFKESKWKNFFPAVKEQDWGKAAAESSRKDVGSTRNDWTRDQFLEASKSF